MLPPFRHANTPGFTSTISRRGSLSVVWCLHSLHVRHTLALILLLLQQARLLSWCIVRPKQAHMRTCLLYRKQISPSPNIMRSSQVRFRSSVNVFQAHFRIYVFLQLTVHHHRCWAKYDTPLVVYSSCSRHICRRTFCPAKKCVSNERGVAVNFVVFQLMGTPPACCSRCEKK